MQTVAHGGKRILTINQRRAGSTGNYEYLVVREFNKVAIWENKVDNEITKEQLAEVNKHFDREDAILKSPETVSPFYFSEFNKPVFSTQKKGRRSTKDPLVIGKTMTLAPETSVLSMLKSSANSAFDQFGSLEEGDVPLKIKKVKLCNNSGLGVPEKVILEFWVEWKPRRDGTRPNDSIITNTMLRKYHPSILIDFYENQLVFEEDISFTQQKENIGHPISTKIEPETIKREPIQVTAPPHRDIFNEQDFLNSINQKLVV